MLVSNEEERSERKANIVGKDEAKRNETRRGGKREEREATTLYRLPPRVHTPSVCTRGRGGGREETPKVTSTPAKRYPMEADRSFLLPVPLPPLWSPPRSRHYSIALCSLCVIRIPRQLYPGSPAARVVVPPPRRYS